MFYKLDSVFQHKRKSNPCTVMVHDGPRYLAQLFQFMLSEDHYPHYKMCLAVNLHFVPPHPGDSWPELCKFSSTHALLIIQQRLNGIFYVKTTLFIAVSRFVKTKMFFVRDRSEPCEIICTINNTDKSRGPSLGHQTGPGQGKEEDKIFSQFSMKPSLQESGWRWLSLSWW